MSILGVLQGFDELEIKRDQAQKNDKTTSPFAGSSNASSGEGETMSADEEDAAVENSFVNKSAWNESLTPYQRMSGVLGKEAVGGMFGKPFAIGGDLQTHGSDWSTGLTHIDAGGSHEESPYDGVQMGVDPEGVPNLVEEGEVVFNDYVFSNRIKLDREAKRRLHFPKKADLTYAEAAKKLEKEIVERPNDPVSKAGFKAQMQQLEEQQERQKQEMEAEKAKAAFEALSPEEQTALMQRAAQEEQMAQQVAEQQAIAEQQTAQPTPEEAIAMQQMQVEPQDNFAEQQAIVAANGGELVKAGDVEPRANKFKWGSRMKKKYDLEWFKRQARALGIDDKYMGEFGDIFDPNDPDSNLAAFNAIFARQQQDQAAETYMKGQRQAKENALFDSKTGLYRMSDDGTRVFKATIGDKDRTGWINKDYNGTEGFLDEEAYQKLPADQKEAYIRRSEKAGDRLLDFNGNVIWGNAGNDKEGKPLTREALLDQYSEDYKKGFKWNEKDASTLQYPKEMRHSAMSNLRYLPALGGMFGLIEDAVTSPNYSGPEAVEKASTVAPRYVGSSYNPTYVKPKKFDIWSQRNRNAANMNSAIRTFANSTNPNKNANILATLYNATNADGQLGINADRYNREDEFRVAAHNSGENKTAAHFDMQAQLANQRALADAQKLGFEGAYYGARMRDEIDARRAASRNANLTNLLTSLGNIGEEAYDWDRANWLMDTGVLKYPGATAAKGGKLKKKKGLTF